VLRAILGPGLCLWLSAFVWVWSCGLWQPRVVGADWTHSLGLFNSGPAGFRPGPPSVRASGGGGGGGGGNVTSSGYWKDDQ